MNFHKTRRDLLRFASVTLCTCLPGCAVYAATYRYKLTLTAEVNGETFRGFNVVEVTRHSTQTGTVHTRVTGEALYVDLGEGRRPLIALLTSKPRPTDKTIHRRWQDMHPTTVLLRAYDEDLSGQDFIEITRRVARHTGARPISFDDLPDLVTFDDVRDPTTILAVDPSDLSSALGFAATLQQAEIEVTDAPITSGLISKLPWLSSTDYNLDGSKFRTGSSLAGTTHKFDFIRRGF
jgi:hypothetical protein